jgi:hypothetical protein
MFVDVALSIILMWILATLLSLPIIFLINRRKRIKRHLDNFFWGLHNWRAYRKAVWDESIWGFENFYQMLYVKLDIQIKAWQRGKQYCVGSERRLHEMIIARELCRRIRDDVYYDMFNKKVEFFVGKGEAYRGIHFEPIENSICDRIVFDYTSERAGQYYDKYSLKYYQSLRDQDMDMLFHLLRHHSGGWWD